MVTDAEARRRMAEILLGRMERDANWRRDFLQAVAALFYDTVHTNCATDCPCVTGQFPNLHRRSGAPVNARRGIEDVG
jgi:hypothetical protein